MQEIRHRNSGKLALTRIWGGMWIWRCSSTMESRGKNRWEGSGQQARHNN